MKILFLILFISWGVSSFCQYTPFQWDSEKMVFAAVEMEVKEVNTNKIIFKGYKNSKIEITNTTVRIPKNATATMNLGGYFQMSDGAVHSVTYKTDKDNKTEINYTFLEGKKYAFITFHYKDSHMPESIFILTTADLMAKPQKKLQFFLKGFE